MNVQEVLASGIKNAVKELYSASLDEVKLEVTNPDFTGDFTFVVFPLLRISKKKPEETAEQIGDYLKANGAPIQSYNVVKGFLNLVTQSHIWTNFLTENWNNADFGKGNTGTGHKVMVEYSSPNTNKPLHLGHIRNNLLGYSLAQIMKANDYDIVKANLINDRGIHICKSMLAWKKFGNGETPESSVIKGDHLVGKYYVEFEKRLRLEVQEVKASISRDVYDKNLFDSTTIETIKDLFNKALSWASDREKMLKVYDEIDDIIAKRVPLMQEAQEMLRDWEAGDSETMELWGKMNAWVYAGFDITYKRLGVDFDTFYYESQTYKLGKNIIDEGLGNSVFFKKEDGSVWIDLSGDGLDQKLLLRSDGTSVYMTQDLGTADLKYEQHGADQSIYVVGNEQDYHFKALFLIMKKLGRDYAQGMHHLSYGMVDLPEGKMKSREGTVVDADDLMNDMHETAKQKTLELGKTQGLDEAALNELYENIGMAALKFFILKVDPKKRMLFNPAESIDFQGDTGPFVLYTYARIQSVLRMAGDDWKSEAITSDLLDLEKSILEVLYRMPETVEDACKTYSPAVICHYLLDLAKTFNRLYNELPLLREADPAKRSLRLKMASMTANSIHFALNLLGIKTVERM